jgi:hypothetical protein
MIEKVLPLFTGYHKGVRVIFWELREKEHDVA